MFQIANYYSPDMAFIGKSSESAPIAYDVSCPSLPGQMNMHSSSCERRVRGQNIPAECKRCDTGKELIERHGVQISEGYTDAEVKKIYRRSEEQKESRREAARERRRVLRREAKIEKISLALENLRKCSRSRENAVKIARLEFELEEMGA
jgi:hypothetical protein